MIEMRLDGHPYDAVRTARTTQVMIALCKATELMHPTVQKSISSLAFDFDADTGKEVIHLKIKYGSASSPVPHPLQGVEMLEMIRWESLEAMDQDGVVIELAGHFHRAVFKGLDIASMGHAHAMEELRKLISLQDWFPDCS